jgi:hypothetical protein
MYSINVAMPGYLPDNDSYPYEVETKEDAFHSAIYEFEMSMEVKTYDVYYAEEVASTFKHNAMQAFERLDNPDDDLGIWTYELPDDRYSLVINNMEKIENAY